MLGAAREQDIIAWEGDFDVFMTRADMRKVAAKNKEIRQKYNLSFLFREQSYSRVCDWFPDQPEQSFNSALQLGGRPDDFP